MTRIVTHAELIAEKGTAAIAAATGAPRAHVRVWKHRRIPRSVYAELIEAFPDVTLDVLKAGEPPANDTAPQGEAA